MGSRHPGSTETEGMVIHWAGFYDRIMKLLFLGRESHFRRRMLDAAALEPGQRVLDVGCGSGTLAVAAASVVGHDGQVFGIDPAGEMIARARSKADGVGANVEFEVAAVESLPFPDGRMDVVISTLVFHHLTRRLQGLAMAEMRRVLAPGGRLVVIDFGGARQIGRLTTEATSRGFSGVTSRRLGPSFLFVLSAVSP